MKMRLFFKCWVFVAFFLLNFTATGQTFSGSGGMIADNGTTIIFPIEVPVLFESSLGPDYGLEAVRITIFHSFTSDLDIALMAPDSTFVELASGLGWDGDNYYNTYFTGHSYNPVFFANPPFSGIFSPSGDLGIINNGQLGTGTWKLYIRDMRPNSTQGSLVDWSLVFGDEPSLPFQFESSNLPIFVIDTRGQFIPDDPKVAARLGIIDNGPGQRNHLTDPFNGYDGFIGIERRGSSSQDFPKKSWGFETWDSTGQDIDVALLGMPEESDWILNAHYTDKTLMRNVLTYYLSNRMGRYAARTRFCEVVLNGQYWGVYTFMEKIKRNDHRVDIAKLDETDTIAPGLTGGYILKIDKETGSGGEGWDSRYPPYVHNHGETVFIQYDYPEFADLLPLQDEYIRNYVDTFETALYNFTGQAPYTHHNYMDIGSFADFFILNELTRNVDGYRLSTYFHKDREGKVTMGPVWDFDLAWGNANYCEATEPDGWVYMFHTYCPGGEWQQPFWWVRLMQDSIYVNELGCRWEALSRSFLSFDSIHEYITGQVALLDEGQERNFTKWPILGVWVWPNPWPLPLTYDEEVMNLKLFAMRRLTWLNSNMPAGCKYAGVPEETAETITIYPNPVKGILHLDLPSSDRKIRHVELFNAFGQELQSVNLWQTNTQVNVSHLSPGLYFLKVFMADEVQVLRFVKAE